MRVRILATLMMLCGASFAARADFSDKLPEVPTPIAVRTKEPAKKKDAPSQKQGKDNKVTNKKEPAATESPTSSSGGGLMNSPDVFAHDTNAPLSYTAKNMDGSRKSGMVILIDDVVIVQAELTLHSDRAELFSTPKSTTPQRVVAKGNVLLDKKGLTPDTSIHATADEIEYFVDTKKAVLRGKPKIWKGKEMLRGEIIELDMVTEAIKVKNPSGVVDPKAAKNESKDGGTAKSNATPAKH